METIDIWTSTLLAAMSTMWSEIAGLLPNAIAAVFLLVIGYFVAIAARKITARLLELSGLNQFSEKTGIAGGLSRLNVQMELAEILSGFVYWIVILIFLLIAAEIVGLTRLAMLLDEFILYLPHVVGALVIILLGLYVAGWARSLVTNSADSVGIEYSSALGAIVYGLITVLVFSLAVGELDLEVEILNQAITVVLVSVGFASALAFGLGAREIAANVMAGSYLKELYQDDDMVEMGDIKGQILFVGSVKTVIKTDKGEISISNTRLIQQDVIRVDG